MLPGLHFFKNGLFTQISEVLAYSFLLAAPLYIVFIFRLWSGISDKFLRVIALIQAAFYLAAFVLIFPGLISFDDMNLATSLIKAVPSGSKSLTYSFVSSSGLMLLNGFGFTVLLSISIFIFINMTVLKMLNDSKLSPKQRFSMGSLLLLLTLLPINQSQILFSCRDTIFSLFVFSLGLQFFRKNSFTLSKLSSAQFLYSCSAICGRKEKCFYFCFQRLFYFYAFGIGVKLEFMH